MPKHALVLTALPFALICGALAANAQQTGGPFIEHSDQPQVMQRRSATEGQARAIEDEGHERFFGPMMGGGAAGMRGMMGGRMGQGAMASPLMMRMIFALMDADGDGTVSLDEFKAAHERIFKAMDANKDGKLTPEEMLAFMRGASREAPRP
jgi:EF hand domain-containing protein